VVTDFIQDARQDPLSRHRHWRASVKWLLPANIADMAFRENSHRYSLAISALDFSRAAREAGYYQKK
jgi:hypothetical protein